MLTIRSINPSELTSWAALDDRPDQFLQRQLNGLVERGASRAGWLCRCPARSTTLSYESDPVVGRRLCVK